MTKTRIETNSQGEFYTLIPEDIVQELVLEEGELINWYVDEGMVELTFG